MLDIPWNVRTDDSDDLVAARAVLDADHAGLDDVKERLIEFLAVRARRNRRGLATIGGRGSGAVMALVGPPGVGKTSLGESVARALGRKFVRVALGGVRDEAEIRGHRRTYVGALPGRIVRAIREAGSMNPVVLLDEIDKVGADYRGDPTAALLEVLDPAQNHTFRDHYLEVDLDLSDVLFLATANVARGHPRPAGRPHGVGGARRLHRGGEGRHRARPPAAPADRAGRPGAVETSSRPSRAEHDRGGVHPRGGRAQLERGLAKVLRKVTVALDGGRDGAGAHRRGHTGQVPRPAEVHAGVGGAHGGAGCGDGACGDRCRWRRALHRSHAMDGDPGLTLTGQLGDVMKESARSRSRTCGRKGDNSAGGPGSRRKLVHVHVPAGAVPKDGPSAGVTMTTALASLASGRPVRSTVGMTGEVTLQGRVLPIGGVKQKLLAAHRAGLTDVIIPKRNEPDLDDLPESVRRELRVHPVADVAEVLELALESAPAVAQAA